MAQDFNKGIYKYLVATDAIGMGLNLNIKRIIFTTTFKYNNERKMAPMENAQIRQIAGRAGRLEEKGGFVAAFTLNSVEVIRAALRGVNDQVESNTSKLTLHHSPTKSDIEDEQFELVEDESKPILAEELLAEESILLAEESKPQESTKKFNKNQREISHAVIFPSFHHLAEFNKNLEVLNGSEVPFPELINKFNELAKIGGMYSLQNYEEFYGVTFAHQIAVAIQSIKLTLFERYSFCISPLPFSSRNYMTTNAEKNKINAQKSGIFDTLQFSMDLFMKYIRDYSEFGEVEFGIDHKKLIKQIKKAEDLDRNSQLRSLEDLYSRSRL